MPILMPTGAGRTLRAIHQPWRLLYLPCARPSGHLPWCPSVSAGKVGAFRSPSWTDPFVELDDLVH